MPLLATLLFSTIRISLRSCGPVCGSASRFAHFLFSVAVLILPADPWQVALNDMHTFEGVSAALDDIAGVLGSCTFYERIYDSELESAKAVFEQLPRLYAHCLRFMAKAIEYFQTATASELSRR